MNKYRCEICGKVGYPLKPGYRAMGMAINTLCTDDFIEYEIPKHRRKS